MQWIFSSKELFPLCTFQQIPDLRRGRFFDWIAGEGEIKSWMKYSNQIRLRLRVGPQSYNKIYLIPSAVMFHSIRLKYSTAPILTPSTKRKRQDMKKQPLYWHFDALTPTKYSALLYFLRFLFRFNVFYAQHVIEQFCWSNRMYKWME